MGIKITLSILVSFLSISLINAQSTKTVTWTKYQVKFQCPNDFVVKENSPIIFTGGNSQVVLSLYPRKGDTLAHGAIAGELKKWASQNKVTTSSPAAKFVEGLSDYYVYQLDGTDYRGKPTTTLILVDVRHRENVFYGWMQYETGKEVDVANIIKSFKQ